MLSKKLVWSLRLQVIITNQDDFQADVEGDLPRDIKRGDVLMIAHRTK